MSQRAKSKIPTPEGIERRKKKNKKRTRNKAKELTKAKEDKEIIIAKKDETAFEILGGLIEKIESAPKLPEPKKKAPKEAPVVLLKAVVQKRGSDGATKIYVDGARPKWFDLPHDMELVLGDEITFSEGPEKTMNNIVKTGHIQTAKEKADAINQAREVSPVVTKVKGLTVTEYDIKNGVWKLITGGSKIRPNPDWELETIINGNTISFHVHQPDYAKGKPLPGQIMKNGSMTMTQTPSKVIDAILKFHDRPKAWDKSDKEAWRKEK